MMVTKLSEYVCPARNKDSGTRGKIRSRRRFRQTRDSIKSRERRIAIVRRNHPRNTHIRRRILPPPPLCTRGRGALDDARANGRAVAKLPFVFFFACVTSTNTMACSRRCAGVLGVCALAIAIALGVGLGIGLRKDGAAAGIYVYGETTLTGFNKAEFESSASNELNFRKGIASLSSTVDVADVSVTSVTDVARRRRRNALRRMLAVTSRVKIDFTIKVATNAEQSTVKSTYVAVTSAALQTALTNEGLSCLLYTSPSPRD